MPPELMSANYDRHEKIFAYEASQDVEGWVTLRIPSSSKGGLEHLGITVQFIGRIDMSIGAHEGKPHYDFISLSKELAAPGVLYQPETRLPFRFRNMDKELESYHGRNVAVRYLIKVKVERKFLPPVSKEHEVWVQLLGQEPTQHEPIKMEVGIEDCLHIEFEYARRMYHLQDTIIGKIHFLLVRIKIKHMELAVIRREASGEGVAAAAASEASTAPSSSTGGDAAANIFTETQTLVKYEIMDGAPVKGEVIPVKLCLKGIPADLTPTYSAANNRFSVRYFLNLVLVDEDDRRYFKQQEIILWRKELG
jgi:vacuolar protein sorting-associated protein 26